jgi:hypothetical protein
MAFNATLLEFAEAIPFARLINAAFERREFQVIRAFYSVLSAIMGLALVARRAGR